MDRITQSLKGSALALLVLTVVGAAAYQSLIELQRAHQRVEELFLVHTLLNATERNTVIDWLEDEAMEGLQDLQYNPYAGPPVDTLWGNEYEVRGSISSARTETVKWVRHVPDDELINRVSERVLRVSIGAGPEFEIDDFVAEIADHASYEVYSLGLGEHSQKNYRIVLGRGRAFSSNFGEFEYEDDVRAYLGDDLNSPTPRGRTIEVLRAEILRIVQGFEVHAEDPTDAFVEITRELRTQTVDVPVVGVRLRASFALLPIVAIQLVALFILRFALSAARDRNAADWTLSWSLPRRNSGEDRLSRIVSSLDWIVWRLLGVIVLLGPSAVLLLAALVAGFPGGNVITVIFFAVFGLSLLLVTLDNIRLLVAVSRKV